MFDGLSGLLCRRCVAMYFFGRNVISLFTTVHDDLLMEQALLYLKMSVPFYIFLGQIFVYRNALQGIGIASVPLISSLLELGGRSVSACPGGHVGLLRHLLRQPHLLGHGGLVYRRILSLGHAHHEGQGALAAF